MKLYIANCNLKNINYNLIKKYLYNEEFIFYIYSNEGIYNIKNNKLIKLKIIDKNIHTHSINNIECIIDNSIIIDNNEHYQLPIDNVQIKIKRLYYQLRTKSLVKLILDIDNNNNIIDFYFDIDSINNNINEDILSFLFYLIFIKNI